ncbi:MAG: EAL domain-containing protein [Erythrobacter sp.]
MGRSPSRDWRLAVVWRIGAVEAIGSARGSLQGVAKHAIAGTVLSALSAGDLPPQRLELEITERVFIADVDQTLARLRSLRNLAVRIALDDFGTGYSSLSCPPVSPCNPCHAR